MPLEEIKNAELILPKREIEIAQGMNVFGRSDFVSDLSREYLDYITSNEGGRYHFTIINQGGACYIQDANSTNGTKLNGREIKGTGKKVLKNGDRITLAGINNFTITFKAKQLEQQISKSEQFSKAAKNIGEVLDLTKKTIKIVKLLWR